MMRVAVTMLSVITGFVMFELTSVPMRLGVILSSGERPHEAMGSLALFALWTVATALAYSNPGIACGFFVIAGGVGLYDGITFNIESFTLWGAAAIVLAALTSATRREKRLADQAEWARSQHELAVHAALRSLHETVPELLDRAAETEERSPRLTRLVELQPDSPALREVARR